VEDSSRGIFSSAADAKASGKDDATRAAMKLRIIVPPGSREASWDKSLGEIDIWRTQIMALAKRHIMPNMREERPEPTTQDPLEPTSSTLSRTDMIAFQ
jgi:hypothetical protein